MNHSTKEHAHEAGEHSCGCGCGAPPKTSTCCHMVCLSRPKYHCGHLLTDEDLALEQRYLIEKNRLRNRTLHGDGVVCGLVLTCAPDCSGNVTIGAGYAIDDCGNDLIVCESRKWDVVKALRDKHWLLDEPAAGDCEPGDEPPDCDVKQCFPIVACYEEEFSEYTTPFDVGCNAGPKQCLPTRVAEKVRFDVLRELPERKTFFDSLKAKIGKCYDAFTEGPIGRTLKANGAALKQAVSGDPPASTTGKDPFCELFCLLRAQFLQQLRYKPDRQFCVMYAEVKALECPERNNDNYGRDLKEAFCKLFEYMLRYLYDCVLLESLIECPEPCEAHCVVLGTVEVLHGEVVRVCNTPRWYVWSFRNLLPLVYQYIVSQAPKAALKPDVGLRPGHDEEGGDEPEVHLDTGCCPDPFAGVDVCACFLAEFEQDQDARKYVALAPLLAVEAFIRRALRSLNIADPCSYSPRLLQSAQLERMNSTASALGLNVTAIEAAALFPASDPLGAFSAEMLLRRGSTILAGKVEGGDEYLAAAYIPPALAQGIQAGEVANGAKADVDSLKKSVGKQIKSLEEEIKKLKDQMDKLSPGPIR